MSYSHFLFFCFVLNSETLELQISFLEGESVKHDYSCLGIRMVEEMMQ